MPTTITYKDLHNMVCESLKTILGEFAEPTFSKHRGIESWYRGIEGTYDELKTKRQIWLADEPTYAAEYADECQDGHLYKMDIDTSRLKLYDWYCEADKWFDPYDGFSDEEINELKQEGYNGYTFALDEATVLVLFDKSLIVNIEELPLEEYIED